MKKLKYIIILIAVIIFVVSTSLYITDETEQVIVTRLGKPVGEPILNPGIHVKLPFLDTPHFFDKRFLEWDGQRNQIPTKDKRFIWVDTYARWQIVDPLLFYKRLRDERGAHSRLDDIIDGETRNVIANSNLIEVVRSTNRAEEIADSIISQETDPLTQIKIGRHVIAEEVLKNAQLRTGDLGIKILDFKFKRINYVKEVQEKVFERMITERKRIADKYRSEGEGEASRINGEKDRELQRIQSEAFKTAEEIKGKADAKATAIYTQAYNQNAQSRDFYEFTKTMETYKNTIDSSTKLILSTESEFYKFFKKK
ncbi:MAG: protease modulator HflC [Candidatus Marinimicrobia bacterium]|nr:protease modulator HflC [Candidatus Neomarinimicrobiota bacterium]